MTGKDKTFSKKKNCLAKIVLNSILRVIISQSKIPHQNDLRSSVEIVTKFDDHYVHSKRLKMFKVSPDAFPFHSARRD